MKVLNERIEGMERLEQVRKDLSSYFIGFDSKFKVVNPNNHGDLSKRVAIISHQPGSRGEVIGNEYDAPKRDGEDVSVKVIVDEKEVEGKQRVRVTVHGVLEGKIGSGEAAERAVKLYGLIHDWVRVRAEYTGTEYARTDGSPQERYLMRE